MAIYCIDFLNGNDTSGNGTAGAPYKTLQKFYSNTAVGFITLVAGDEVRFRGDTCQQVTMPNAYLAPNQLPTSPSGQAGLTRQYNGKAWVHDVTPVYNGAGGFADWNAALTIGGQTYGAVYREPTTGWIAVGDVPTVGANNANFRGATTGTQVPANTWPLTPTLATSTNKVNIVASRPAIPIITWSAGNISGVPTNAYLRMNVSTAGYSQVVISGGWNSTFTGPETGDWATSFTSIVNYNATTGFSQVAGGRGQRGTPSTAIAFLMNGTNANNNGIVNTQFGLEIKNFHLHGVNMWYNIGTAGSFMPGGWYKETNCSINDSYYPFPAMLGPSNNISGGGAPFFRYYWLTGGWRKGFNEQSWNKGNFAFGSTTTNSKLTSTGGVKPINGLPITTGSLETEMNTVLVENMDFVASPVINAVSSANGDRSFPTYWKNIGIYSIPAQDVYTYTNGGSSPQAVSEHMGIAYLCNATGTFSLKSPLVGLMILGPAQNGNFRSQGPKIQLTTGYAPHGIQYKGYGNSPCQLEVDTSLYTYTSYWGGFDQVDPTLMGLEYLGAGTSSSGPNPDTVVNSQLSSTGSLGTAWPTSIQNAQSTFDLLDGTAFDTTSPESFANASVLNYYYNGKLFQLQQNGLIVGVSDSIYETGSNSLFFKHILGNYETGRVGVGQNYSSNPGTKSTRFVKVWEGVPTSTSNSIGADVRYRVNVPYTDLITTDAKQTYLRVLILQDNRVIGAQTLTNPDFISGGGQPTDTTGWLTDTVTIGSGTYQAGKPLQVWFGGLISCASNNTYPYPLTNPDSYTIFNPNYFNQVYVDRVEITPTNIWQ